MKTLVTVGEALIDFSPTDTGAYLPTAGGAPANVAAAAAKLGAPVRFLGAVGADAFGRLLLDALHSSGADTAFAAVRGVTPMAVVEPFADGERDYHFYEGTRGGALLLPGDVTEAVFAGCGALHFCSLSLADPRTRAAHTRAIGLAKAAGAMISFDVNLRRETFANDAVCRTVVTEYIRRTDLLKASQSECMFLCGRDGAEGAKALLELGVKAVLLSRGAKGVLLCTKKATVELPCVPVHTVDPTGAGDALAGSFLYACLSRGIDADTLAGAEPETLYALCDFANRYAAKTTEKPGAIPSYPSTAAL